MISQKMFYAVSVYVARLDPNGITDRLEDTQRFVFDFDPTAQALAYASCVRADDLGRRATTHRQLGLIGVADSLNELQRLWAQVGFAFQRLRAQPSHFDQSFHTDTLDVRFRISASIEGFTR